MIVRSSIFIRFYFFIISFVLFLYFAFDCISRGREVGMEDPEHSFECFKLFASEKSRKISVFTVQTSKNVKNKPRSDVAHDHAPRRTPMRFQPRTTVRPRRTTVPFDGNSCFSLYLLLPNSLSP